MMCAHSRYADKTLKIIIIIYKVLGALFLIENY